VPLERLNPTTNSSYALPFSRSTRTILFRGPIQDLVVTAIVVQKEDSRSAVTTHRNLVPTATPTPLPPRWPPCNYTFRPNPGLDGRLGPNTTAKVGGADT
jgi:hypothetical protein